LSNNSLNKIAYWDGKAKIFGVHVSKIEAYTKFIGIGDALDPLLMDQFPTQLGLQQLTPQDWLIRI
jgi:hypothetical protein